MITSYVILSGTAAAANGAANGTILAAQGAGKRIYVLRGFVSVHVAAVGGGGLVGLEDGVGGTRFFNSDADAVGFYPVDFGEEGYPLSANTLFNVAVSGAGTTQASARATFVCKIV